ncbi:septal ring lytic transglycosylase RlpA family protein [Granulicella sp. L46]|uniref:septal ring lytic transglycosylase RlpA family protein n=1 Tax=Granulicella sp. L46 TaxID=1641865 RepID=UPI0020B10DD8|nr:septal ring lytic transglycosylase RlpA family protein [Granulicella sp. L46]
MPSIAEKQLPSIANKQMPVDADRRVPGIAIHSDPRSTPPRRWPMFAGATFVALALTTGCHHQKHQAYAPAPPPLRTQPSARPNRPDETRRDREPVPAPQGRPEFVETGMASWYGPSGHRAADGSSYDGTGMTAAHKTLPLGTIARVTNLANGESVTVRITDRGPFSHGRVLDLSESAAKKIDLYRMGVAQVRIEAFAPSTPTVEAKWCVQTGAFPTEQDALDLKSALARRYAGSRVIEFASATGYWVRIDPVKHDHTEAAAIKDWIGTPLPQVVPYLVRVN